FAGALVVIVLSAYGYVGTDESTIKLALPGLVNLMSWIPGIFGIAAAVLMLAYPLSDRKMAEIEAELIARRGQANN
ncbi:MAG: hypothetical protein ACKO96_30660, partial [Flammeovirgaceae bacterium]